MTTAPNDSQWLDGLMTRYTLQSNVRKGDEIVHYLDDQAKAAIAAKLETLVREAYDKGYMEAVNNEVNKQIEGIMTQARIMELEGLLKYSTNQVPTGSFYKTAHVLPAVLSSIIIDRLAELKAGETDKTPDVIVHSSWGVDSNHRGPGTYLPPGS